MRFHVATRIGASLLGAVLLSQSLQFAAQANDAVRQPEIVDVAGDASGAHYKWKAVSIGGGGFITGFDADLSGLTRVVRTDVYGAYIWTENSGGTGRWSQLVTAASMPKGDHSARSVNEGVYEIVVAPSDANRIYMALKGHVYRSENAGRTFEKMTVAGLFPVLFDPNSAYRLNSRFMAVDPDYADVVFLGTPHAGLLRSTDGGENWVRVMTVPASRDLAPQVPGEQSAGHLIWFKPGNNGHHDVWVNSPGNGVYRSRNGADFELLGAQDGEYPTEINHGVFSADGTFYAVESRTNSVWKFDDRWRNITSERGLGPERYASVAINPRDQKIYLFTRMGKAFVSDVHGAGWWRMATRSSAGASDPPWLKISNTSFAIASVVFDPVVPDRIWVSAGTGVYFADLAPDALEISWVSQTRGIEELVTNDIYQAPGRAPLFAAWDFGIHRKENLDEFSKGYGPKERVLIAAQQVVGTPSNPDFVATNASDTLRCCSEDGDTILAGYSLDAGRTWRKFRTLPKPPILEEDKARLGGAWLMSYGMIAVASDDQKNIVWVPSANKAPFVTNDLGETWQQIHFPGENPPYTGSHRDYYLARRVLSADTVAPGTFYLVHSGNTSNTNLTGVWRSENGGKDWSKVYAGEIAANSVYSAKLRAVPKFTGHLFFTTGLSGTSGSPLRRSVDGGATWVDVENVEDVDDVAFGRPAPNARYPAIYVSGKVNGQYGIWQSTDEAGSWRQIGEFPVGSLDQVANIGADPDHFGRVYLGFKGSGWVYGELSACKARLYGFLDTEECYPAK